MQPEWLWVAGAAVFAFLLLQRRCASRIGDRVAFRGLRDVAEFDPRDSDDPECWFLPNAVAAAGLPGLPALLKDASFRRRANKQLEPWFD